MRILLGRILRLDPGGLRFERNAYGKPHLAPGQSDIDIRFNVSDSEDYAVLAVSDGIELGVDLELIRDDIGEDLKGVAEQFYSAAEKNRIEATEAEQRGKLFYNIWTRKEAYLKATGCGLYQPLNSFDVSGASDRIDVGEYRVQSLRWPNESYAAAVAAYGRRWKCCVHLLEPFEAQTSAVWPGVSRITHWQS